MRRIFEDIEPGLQKAEREGEGGGGEGERDNERERERKEGDRKREGEFKIKLKENIQQGLFVLHLTSVCGLAMADLLAEKSPAALAY